MRSVLRISGWVARTVLWIFIGLLFYLSLPLEGKKNIHLDPDSTGGIIAQLAQKGYDVGPIDRWVLSGMGTPLPGWVYLGKTHMHRLELFARLLSRRSHFESVALIPGETTWVFVRQLAQKLDLNSTRLQQAYTALSPFPEAGILAETYHVPLYLHEKGVMHLLLGLSEKRYRSLARSAWGRWDIPQWQRILTIASIIQKEAADTDEMPLIASVIYNRIERHMRLQMDGTLNYGRYSHTRVTPKRIRTDRTTYNTYKHKGLPRAPVCNVSLAAIRAALHPAHTKYLYFMKNDQGSHDFSLTYKSHLKNVHERKRELNTKD